MPATAIFYSTIRNWGWGAPDYVWPLAASKLQQRGISVCAFIRPQLRADPRIRALESAGAKFFPPPPVVYGGGSITHLRKGLARWSHSARTLTQLLRDAPEPHLFIDQGWAFDFLVEEVLLEAISRRRLSYDIFVRSNNYSTPLSPDQRQRARAFLRGADRCLFNSAWTKNVTELQLLDRLPNFTLFTHLVRFEHSTPLPWPESGTVRLATVSRLDVHHKGLDVLLAALPALRDFPRAWTLDIYGDGPDEPYVRDLISWLGLGDRVRLLGRIDNVKNVWRESHLLLLTSRYEGLAVSMLEAMACGRPVLRTPYGGCAEWISPGETGYVCPAAEPELITASLRQALSEFDRWPELGRLAHQRILDRLPGCPESYYLEPFNKSGTSLVSSTPTAPRVPPALFPTDHPPSP